MKKIVLILILAGVIGICIPINTVIANSVKVFSKAESRQTDYPKRKIVKKHRRIMKRRTSARRRHRMNMQLRQANKHLKDEKKAQSAQSKVKTEQ